MHYEFVINEKEIKIDKDMHFHMDTLLKFHKYANRKYEEGSNEW